MHMQGDYCGSKALLLSSLFGIPFLSVSVLDTQKRELLVLVVPKGN